MGDEDDEFEVLDARVINVALEIVGNHKDTLEDDISAYRTPLGTNFELKFRTTAVVLEGNCMAKDAVVTTTIDYVTVFQHLAAAATTEREDLLAANNNDPNAPEIKNLL